MIKIVTAFYKYMYGVGKALILRILMGYLLTFLRFFGFSLKILEVKQMKENIKIGYTIVFATVLLVNLAMIPVSATEKRNNVVLLKNLTIIYFSI